ncbi:LutB/LldF family L-lactate oxidation iron-sulfur protein [Sulfoacidibacillus thermotolerans]|uniref:Iron-sulfur cluster-binding protein n=1 Tax=Sulfoacidibacillus thermotolerans TaxID=1765684 RepID=A0A2U3DBS3_SULT2|nr:LutB/LldF family L-lactate oxidation iron-sulfur protein [Sulfoacidibacillus thermotolerans]PWI58723.1 iron-sulfur cluster-binding protein [Sulfoacidibacillus thermotolerans]
MNPQFDARIRAALKDENLHVALQISTDRLREKKAEAVAKIDFEAWRERGREIRAHVIAHLDFYLGQLAHQVRERKGHVHFCSDANAAVQVIREIVHMHQGKKVIKSKSMVTEELHLNQELMRDGIEVVETDLGEYIIQLAGETPSHIIAPAIHKKREQIADLFSEVANQPIASDTPSLNAFAHKILREKFIQADIGITGCNFAIAETGTICLFTNEGNGRMVTTLPPVHIAVMGMERILPSLEDLEVFMNLLPRSGTGQKLTSYVSLITGPADVQELDGAHDFHLVILDNHRSRSLGDPDFQDVLHCIRCGACLNVCPVYRQIGGHAYQSVYSGPIGAVLTPLLRDDPEAADLPYASSLCGACYESCPVKIPLHDMLVKLRARNVARGHTSSLERVAFRTYQHVFTRAINYRLAVRSLRTVQKWFLKNDEFPSSMPGLSAWTKTRSLQGMSPLTFRERFAQGLTIDQITAQLSNSQKGD